MTDPSAGGLLSIVQSECRKALQNNNPAQRSPPVHIVAQPVDCSAGDVVIGVDRPVNRVPASTERQQRRMISFTSNRRDNLTTFSSSMKRSLMRSESHTLTHQITPKPILQFNMAFPDNRVAYLIGPPCESADGSGGGQCYLRDLRR